MEKKESATIESKSSQIMEFSDDDESDEDDFYLSTSEKPNKNANEILNRIKMEKTKGIS